MTKLIDRSTKARAAKDAVMAVHDIRTGRYERSLCGLMAGAAVITVVEIFSEHDSASFGNRWMWAPIAVNPIAAGAATAGFFSRKAAKTVLPAVSVVAVANGLQGLFFHLRAIGQKPGGWHNTRYNIEMGPPVAAPLAVTLVGGMGLFAALLRREKF